MSSPPFDRLDLLSDNFGWVLWERDGGTCAVIDPSECGPIVDVVRRRGCRVGTILLTHHHWDHTAGLGDLLEVWPDVEVVCSKCDRLENRVPGATRGIDDEAVFHAAGFEVRPYWVPGHTRGSVAYYVPGAELVFTGDTLFSSGCGRLFEGTAPELFASLQRLARLPAETVICCGHEYTEKNLQFAAMIEPGNERVQQRLKYVTDRQRAGERIPPSLLRDELQTNPFLRAGNRALQAVVGISEPLLLFTELRKRRDSF